MSTGPAPTPAPGNPPSGLPPTGIPPAGAPTSGNPPVGGPIAGNPALNAAADGVFILEPAEGIVVPIPPMSPKVNDVKVLVVSPAQEPTQAVGIVFPKGQLTPNMPPLQDAQFGNLPNGDRVTTLSSVSIVDPPTIPGVAKDYVLVVWVKMGNQIVSSSPRTIKIELVPQGPPPG